MLRNITVLKLALIYSCMIALNGSATLRVDTDRQHNPNHAVTCFTVGLIDHQAYAGQEKLANASAESLPQLSKNQVRETTLVARNIAGCYHHALSCYLFYSDNQIRRLEPPDIVYPFHSFW